MRKCVPCRSPECRRRQFERALGALDIRLPRSIPAVWTVEQSQTPPYDCAYNGILPLPAACSRMQPCQAAAISRLGSLALAAYRLIIRAARALPLHRARAMNSTGHPLSKEEPLNARSTASRGPRHSALAVAAAHSDEFPGILRWRLCSGQAEAEHNPDAGLRAPEEGILRQRFPRLSLLVCSIFRPCDDNALVERSASDFDLTLNRDSRQPIRDKRMFLGSGSDNSGEGLCRAHTKGLATRVADQ